MDFIRRTASASASMKSSSRLSDPNQFLLPALRFVNPLSSQIFVRLILLALITSSPASPSMPIPLRSPRRNHPTHHFDLQYASVRPSSSFPHAKNLSRVDAFFESLCGSPQSPRSYSILAHSSTSLKNRFTSFRNRLESAGQTLTVGRK